MKRRDQAVLLPAEPYRLFAPFDRGRSGPLRGSRGRHPTVFPPPILDDFRARIVILHGESGVGKSSFLRAGVIPYLEESCAGYRFLRGPDGRVVIVQAAGDPVGRLAQALLDMTWRPARVRDPDRRAAA